MSAPELMHIREKPNGALGLWHDATSSDETAAIANECGTNNPFYTYIRLDLYEAEIARLREELATARDRALDEAIDAIADYPRASPDYDEWTRYDEQIAHSQEILRALKGAKP